MAAGTNITFFPRLIGTTSVELWRTSSRPFSSRISAVSNGVVSPIGGRDCPAISAEGPSCIFVGPVESASKETLEALYRQARNAYYSGNPLIVDDMFDRVELKLRWYGSKYVVKYPRCSLMRQSTYSDAWEDPSQVFALASVWLLFLGFGGSALLLPVIYTIGHIHQVATGLGFPYSRFSMLNGILLGSVIGYPIASASVGALLDLWKNDLVALKGACPSCGEEVFAFVRPDPSSKSPHRIDCHVCESSLEFRTKVEQCISSLGRRWVHGRIYLLRQRRNNRAQNRL